MRILVRPRRAPSRLRALATLGAVFASSLYAASAREEYDVKAAFLLKFVRFVEWPAGAFSSAGAPLLLCVYGEDPFEGALQTGTQGKPVAGHALEVRKVDTPESAAACHVLFIPDSQSRRIRDIAPSTAQRPVLLVGETEGFASRGGMINFVVQAEHVRFEISPAAASAVGLKISSKLLQLATIVGGR